MNQPKKIFISDDEMDILDILTLMLQAQGYMVRTTVDPNTLFDLKEEELPDIILLDIWMTGIDGRDICNQLKQTERTKHIPVIFISANSNIEEIASSCNAQGYIAKPFEMAEMLNIIRTTLENNPVNK